VTVQQAQADMDSIATHIAQPNPKSNKGWGLYVEPFKNDFLPSERKQTLWLLLGAVAFILLIACVNVANLLLARGLARQKELAVRSALGASRRTIFEQLITESLLLAITGGVLGIGVGYAMLQALIAIMPRGTLPDEVDLTSTFLSCSSPLQPQRLLVFSSAVRQPGMPHESIPANRSKKAIAPV
jgi:putative ABC transport system permease protein